MEDNQLTVGWRMNVLLSFDHRVLDGADAIRFTQTLGEYTRDPGKLLRELILTKQVLTMEGLQSKSSFFA